MVQLLALIVSAVALATTGDALGINCRGNARCSEAHIYQSTTRHWDSLKDIDDNRWYNNGEHITCFTDKTVNGDPPSYISTCSFLQKSGGAPGRSIKKIMEYLKNKCGMCGSVPLFFPESNDNSGGELTVNYVYNTRGCNNGRC